MPRHSCRSILPAGGTGRLKGKHLRVLCVALCKGSPRPLRARKRRRFPWIMVVLYSSYRVPLPADQPLGRAAEFLQRKGGEIMKKVVVAIDGSDISKGVINYALHYAAREGCGSAVSSSVPVSHKAPSSRRGLAFVLRPMRR